MQPSYPILPLSGQEESLKNALAQLQKDSGNGSGRSLEELLLEQMDLAVVAFANIMRDTTIVTNEDGELKPQYTFTEKMKAAEFVRDWVQRRRKLQPAAIDDDAPNITELRKAIREETLATLERERVLRAPPKKNGRPTREEAAQKKAIAEAAAAAQAEIEEFDALDEEIHGEDNEPQRALKGK